MSIDDPTGRLMRWRFRLSSLEFLIIHRSTRKNQVPNDVYKLPRKRTALPFL